MASESPIRNLLSLHYTGILPFRKVIFTEQGTGPGPRRKLRDRVTFPQGLNISVFHRVCRIRELVERPLIDWHTHLCT